MLARLFGCTVLGLVLCSFGLEAGGTKDAKKDAVVKDGATKDGAKKDSAKDGAKKDSAKDGAKKDTAKDGAKKDSAKKDDAKKDTAKKDDAKKDKKTEVAGTKGKIKSTDLEKLSFTVTLEGGKDMTYTINDKTKFIGPRGGDRGTGKAGLKDDCMAKGYDVRVVVDPKDAKVASEVHLANRKGEKKATKKTDK